MFVKIVIILLLLIVAASLLAGRGGNAANATPAARPLHRVRPLMMRVALVLLALGAVLAAVHLSGCSRPENGFLAQDITGADYGQINRLDGFTDHTGRRLASADFFVPPGKLVVLFFGYTRCPDICPTNLSTFQEALRLLGPQADRVQVLFVTVDPERDTQAVLASYVPWFDQRFLGLRAEVAATREAAKAFRVFYARTGDTSALGYSIDHTANSYVYDTLGRLRLSIAHGASAADVAADLTRLLAGV